MKIFKETEKPKDRIADLEEFAVASQDKIEYLEKKIKFLIVPILYNLLEDTIFSNKRGMGYNPILLWFSAILRNEKLPQEARIFLTEMLEKYDFKGTRLIR